MDRRTALLVVVEVIGVEVGHWCNRCMLSSGIRIWYAVQTGPRLCFHSAIACTDCEHEDVELTEAPATVWES